MRGLSENQRPLPTHVACSAVVRDVVLFVLAGRNEEAGLRSLQVDVEALLKLALLQLAGVVGVVRHREDRPLQVVSVCKPSEL